ncbi:MAG: three-Cys-motif partner protein TcmP [Candidatus Jordarchaeaceae archaeon]
MSARDLLEKYSKDGCLWPIEPHTRAKHEILQNYLKAWFPILSTIEERIIYLDGFAGPGIYTGGEFGSPVIALQTAVNHNLRERFREIIFIFIEKDTRRAEILEQVLKKQFPNLPENIKYEILGAEFASTIEKALDEIEKQGARLAPTFAFLDPFGFTGFPMNLVGRMMNYDKCEVLITFMAGFMRRFLDEYREPALNALFATEEWKKARDIKDPNQRLRFLLDLYERQLRNVGGARYVRSFGMIGANNQVIYYLVYGTKHLRGLEVMKEAMFKVDRRGTYTFSDLTDVNQTYLIDYSKETHWVPGAGEMVYNKFRGKTVTECEIHKFVILETPFVYRKSILKQLESCKPPKIIDVTNRRRKFSYPEKCHITFSR